MYAAIFALVLLAVPLAGEAAQPTKVARIGYLVTGLLESPETRVTLDAFRQGLRERGYVEVRTSSSSTDRQGGSLSSSRL